jgi:DNA-binding NtrC family response regulator
MPREAFLTEFDPGCPPESTAGLLTYYHGSREEMAMLDTRLLIVDDEEPFVAALQKRLAHRSVTVFEAYSGAEGLQKLDENPDIDVVLLDVLMPGMGGVETLRRMKAAHPLVEVIMLTGHGTLESAVDGMKLGAFDYLTKPYHLEELLAKVEEAKNKRRSHLLKIMEATGKELRERRAR